MLGPRQAGSAETQLSRLSKSLLLSLVTATSVAYGDWLHYRRCVLAERAISFIAYPLSYIRRNLLVVSVYPRKLAS
jgi:hypothetical protein